MGIALLVMTVHGLIELRIFRSGILSRYGFIHELDLQLLDVKFRSRPQDNLPEPRVVVAAIDEKGVDRFGLWPWRRSVLADFVSAATKGGARVIAFDATFSETDRNASFQDIKNFLDEYDHEGLKSDSNEHKKLQRSLNALSEAQATQETNLATLEKRARVSRGDKAVPQVIKQQIRQAKKAQGDIATQLNAVVAALRSMRQRSEEFRSKMEHVVVAGSPDIAFANALKASPQTVMGFFTFDDLTEIVGVDAEAMESQAKFVLEKSSIDTIYEEVRHDFGIGTEPAEFDMERLWIHEVPAMRAPIPVIGEASQQFGFFNASPDTDGVVRQLRMLHKYHGKLIPALSLAVAARYNDSEIRPMNGLIYPGHTISGVQIGSDDEDNPILVPTDDRGHVIINYYKDPIDYFPVYSVADFVDGTISPEVYKGKVVIFGMTALGLYDQPPTPFAERTPGVFTHAAAIQSMLDNRHIIRPEFITGLELIGFLLLGAVIGLGLPRLSPVSGTIAIIVFAVGFVTLDISVIFPNGYWLKVVPPVTQAVLSLMGIYVHGFLTEGREKLKIRKAFQFYLTKSVVDEMLKEPGKLQLGGERKTCTVLFSDIRGFTSISELLTPEQLSNLLNEYLTPMTNLVFKYDGTLDKYMGDAIMAIFGAPVAYEDHARRSCFAAIEMMEELAVLQEGWRERGVPELDIGIGLNTGPMSVGNMGSEVRFDYTVMGDNVNLGSRLEGINKQYGTNIIISEYTYAAAKEHIHVREIDSVRVKGRREPVVIFELLGKNGATTETQIFIDAFDKGLSAYKAQQWDEAIEAFTDVMENLRKNDYTSNMYVERCLSMKENPPGEDWDGVFTMTTK